jgi:uncharacterized protein (UPF0305 family)
MSDQEDFRLLSADEFRRLSPKERARYIERATKHLMDRARRMSKNVEARSPKKPKTR